MGGGVNPLIQFRLYENKIIQEYNKESQGMGGWLSAFSIFALFDINKIQCNNEK